MPAMRASLLALRVETNFGLADALIVGLYLLASLAIGIYAHRYVGRLQDYLVAGRTLRLKLGVATMIATELGLVTLMYSGQQGFKQGPAALHIGLISFFAVLLIGLTGFIVYRLRATGVMTVPEFYARRYNTRVRWVGGVILATAGIANMGVFLQVDAKFLIAVTGMQEIEVAGWEASTALMWVMIAMMTVVLIYTALGGMVSVVVTDLMQFLLLTLGIAIVTVAVIVHVGWSNVFATVQTQLGRPGFDPLAIADEASGGGGYGLTYVLWMAWLMVSAAALWQSSTIRALSAKSPLIAKQVYALSSIGYLARMVLPAFWGICAYVFILNAPEPLRSVFLDDAGHVRRTAEGIEVDTLYAVPLLIGRAVPTVLLGVVCAGMLAASMSTYSSYLLCWASVITQDIVAPLCRGGLSNRARILLTRFWVVLIGVYLVIFGLLFYTPDIWSFLAATGTVYLSGASAVVVLGLYWKRASTAGAAAALVVGLLGLLAPLKAWLPGGWANASWLANEASVALVTVAASWTAMIALSLLFPDRPAAVAEESKA